MLGNTELRAANQNTLTSIWEPAATKQKHIQTKDESHSPESVINKSALAFLPKEIDPPIN